MSVKLAVLVAGAVALFSSNVRAESPSYPAALIATSETEESSRFVYNVREVLKASRSFRLVDPGSDGFKLRLTTMEMGNFVTYSVVITFTVTDDSGPTDYFISHTVGGCGIGNYPVCAETVVAHFSEEAEALAGGLAAAARESQGFK